MRESLQSAVIKALCKLLFTIKLQMKRINELEDTVTETREKHEQKPLKKEKFGFEIKCSGLDAGYYTAPLCKGLCDRKIQPVIATKLGPHDSIMSFLYILHQYVTL